MMNNITFGLEFFKKNNERQSYLQCTAYTKKETSNKAFQKFILFFRFNVILVNFDSRMISLSKFAVFIVRKIANNVLTSFLFLPYGDYFNDIEEK